MGLARSSTLVNNADETTYEHRTLNYLAVGLSHHLRSAAEVTMVSLF
jgi:hypothetical protein